MTPSFATHTDFRFVVGDRVMSAAEIEQSAPKATRTPPVEKSFHKGFRVEGHPPGAMAEAQKVAEAECAAFARQREQGRSTGKAPKAWDEATWRRTQKKRPVRAKPYEVPESAELCKTMATKEGWLDVEVREVKKVIRDES